MITFLSTNYEGENKPYALSFSEKILEAERYFSSDFNILIDQNGLPRKTHSYEHPELPSIVVKILSGLLPAFAAFESGSYIASPICYIAFRFTAVVITDLIDHLHNRFDQIEYRIIKWPLRLLSTAAKVSLLLAGLVVYISFVFKFLGLGFKNDSSGLGKPTLKLALVALNCFAANFFFGALIKCSTCKIYPEIKKAYDIYQKQMERPKKFITPKTIQITNFGDQTIAQDNLKQIFNYFSSKEILPVRLVNKDSSFTFPSSCFIERRIKESFSKTVINFIGLERLSHFISQPILNIKWFPGIDEGKKIDFNNLIYNSKKPISREHEGLQNILKDRRISFGKKSNGELFLCFHCKKDHGYFIVLNSHIGSFEPWHQPLLHKINAVYNCFFDVYINTDTSLQVVPRKCIRKASFDVPWEDGERIELTKDLFYRVIFKQSENEVFPPITSN